MASGNINIGFMDQRNSSRILKPPGGGYSDIFGTGDTPQIQTPRSKITQSKVHEILSTEHVSVRSENKQNSNSENSNVVKKLDETDSNGTDAEKNQEGNENGDSNIIEGVEKLNVSCEEKKDSNENEQQNEAANKSPRKDSIQDIMNENGHVPQTNGTNKTVVDNVTSKPQVASAPRQKTRVPPGGYSSGLW